MVYRQYAECRGVLTTSRNREDRKKKKKKKMIIKERQAHPGEFPMWGVGEGDGELRRQRVAAETQGGRSWTWGEAKR